MDSKYPYEAFECGENEIIKGARECVGVSDLDGVLQQRGSRYGNFIDNATVAQELKAALHTDKFYELSADKQEALDQIASKISRIVTANCSEYKDSWVDIAGYATLIADTLED